MTEEQTKLIVNDKRTPHPEENLPVAAGPSAVVMMAMQKGYDPAFIEKMMDLQERHEANEAKKAYVKAMAAFKANPPEILKTKHVSYYNSKNQLIEWNHAELGEICEAAIGGMGEHGLYHRWDQERPDNNTVKVTCTITHELGHSESTSMSGPPDTSGGKDTLKAVFSTNTQLQRRTLLALTGLAEKGMDNEGTNGGEPEFITEEQANEINAVLKESGANVEAFLKRADAETVDTIPAKLFNRSITYLKNLKKAKESRREPGDEG